jgi:predicted ATP-grasp superfamily ATP-dependent carboligase
MHVFVYEYLLGRAFLPDDDPPPASMLAEGRAMLTALATDFAALPGIETSVLHDPRCGPLDLPSHIEVDSISLSSPESTAFDRRVIQADWTVVIAPETAGVLARRCRRVLELGGRLLGPNPDLVELAADKHRTAEHLLAHRVPAPRGMTLAAGQALPESFPNSTIMKPRDGAGSQFVRLLKGKTTDDQRLDQSIAGAVRLEPYCPGLAASVALLCGPRQCLSLPACRQVLTDDGRFSYLGGELPLSQALDDRARRLAECAVATLPTPLGYIGVDLVLGGDPSGADDHVIEINPRLTTSYVGLRAAALCNLAEAILLLAGGGSLPLSFDERPLRFWADGTIESAEAD